MKMSINRNELVGGGEERERERDDAVYVDDSDRFAPAAFTFSPICYIFQAI